MLLSDYRPKSAVVTKETPVLKPRFPVIDAHNHLGEPFGGGWDKKPVSQLLDQLDEANIVGYVDLDGGWGEDVLERHLDLFKGAAPERFRVFGGVDWSQWPEQGSKFPEWAAARLREQARRGADGLKVWKPFGLTVTDDKGVLVRVDDPRLDPIWSTAGELGLPIVIHVADPLTFFWPLDGHNERYEQLVNHPEWRFPSPPFPSFESILNGMANMVARNPGTTFIGAHFGCYVENLGWVGDLLDRCPNFYVDTSARINELGRVPYSARRFFIQYADRILFGLDMGPDVETYRVHYRFFETDDEYFNPDPTDVPLQGRWMVYGLYLPDDVLQKLYYGNARRLIFKQ